MTSKVKLKGKGFPIYKRKGKSEIWFLPIQIKLPQKSNWEKRKGIIPTELKGPEMDNGKQKISLVETLVSTTNSKASFFESARKK